MLHRYVWRCSCTRNWLPFRGYILGIRQWPSQGTVSSKTACLFCTNLKLKTHPVETHQQTTMYHKKTAVEIQFCIYRSRLSEQPGCLGRDVASDCFRQKIACHSEVVDPHLLCEITVDYHPHTQLLPPHLHSLRLAITTASAVVTMGINLLKKNS